MTPKVCCRQRICHIPSLFFGKVAQRVKEKNAFFPQAGNGIT
jgi:hypothetical protein